MVRTWLQFVLLAHWAATEGWGAHLRRNHDADDHAHDYDDHDDDDKCCFPPRSSQNYRCLSGLLSVNETIWWIYFDRVDQDILTWSEMFDVFYKNLVPIHCSGGWSSWMLYFCSEFELKFVLLHNLFNSHPGCSDIWGIPNIHYHWP